MSKLTTTFVINKPYFNVVMDNKVIGTVEFDFETKEYLFSSDWQLSEGIIYKVAELLSKLNNQKRK